MSNSFMNLDPTKGLIEDDNLLKSRLIGNMLLIKINK